MVTTRRKKRKNPTCHFIKFSYGENKQASSISLKDVAVLREKIGRGEGWAKAMAGKVGRLEDRPLRGSPEIAAHPPFTLRQAQGERAMPCIRWSFTVRAELVEARFCQLQSRSVVSGEPLSYKRAMERIRLLWKEGTVRYWPHALKRMRERKINAPDVEYLVRYGHVVGHRKPGHVWRYTVAGLSVDGEPISCAVEINGTLVIVTVME